MGRPYISFSLADGLAIGKFCAYSHTHNLRSSGHLFTSRTVLKSKLSPNINLLIYGMNPVHGEELKVFYHLEPKV